MQPLFENVSLSIIGAGCKNRCKHCYINAKISEAALLSLEQMEDIGETIQAENKKAPPFYRHINPCLHYEPMDHPDIVGIQKLFHSLNPEASLARNMPTNGQRIASDASYAEIIQNLQNYGIEHFQLTLHGLKKSHDWFAGKSGAYDSVLEAARRIASLKAKIDWVYFLSKANISEFPEMIELARKASAGTDITESINIWGPAGRARRQRHLLVTETDLDQLPPAIRNMEFLPDYLPESKWIEYAQSGEMQSLLEGFLEEVRKKGGVPDCNLRVDKDNIDDFARIVEEKRSEALAARERKSEMPKPSRPDISWLAERYADRESKVLYRVSTMRQEWSRRWREDTKKGENVSNTR